MRRGKPARHPSAYERDYQRRLLRRVVAAHRLMQARGEPLLRQMEAADRASTRSDDATTASPARLEFAVRWSTLIEAVRRAFGNAFPPAEELDHVHQLGQDVERFTTRATDSVLRALLKVDTVPVLDPAAGVTAPTVLAWARENVDLIRSIDRRYFDDIAEQVVAAVRGGQPASAVAAALTDRYQVSRGRAELIAQDQVAKLNSRITGAKQQAAGVTQYEWSTSGDERVRASHRALDGRVFSWDDPPSEGHPGEPVRCRCVALPVLDDLEDE